MSEHVMYTIQVWGYKRWVKVGLPASDAAGLIEYKKLYEAEHPTASFRIAEIETPTSEVDLSGASND